MAATDSDASLLAARAREIGEIERDTYRDRTPLSQAATDRARRSLPLGVPSSFQAYDPHPVVAKRAQAAWLEDVDGNHYVDFNMGFGALFAGHCHPRVRAAIEEQLDDGTLFVTPCETNADVAELLAERYRLPMWRFTNSGTEATMDAIRVARGVTGRDKLVKVEGGYHGHHDEVMISMKPPVSEAGPPDAPRAIPATAGITRAVLGDTVVIPYNRPDVLDRVLEGGDVACFIVEPVMENIGICLPEPGYLEAVREITRRHGTLLIFDEVKTGITAGWGGATGALGVEPDLVSLGQVDRRRPPDRRVRRAAGVHGLRRRREGAAPRHLQRQPARDGGDQGRARRRSAPRRRPRRRSTATAATWTCATPSSPSAHCRPTRCSSAPRAASPGRPTPVRNYRDYKATDFDLAFAQWLWGINRGVLLPPGLDEQWLISVMHDDDDIAHGVEVFRSFADAVTA